MRVLARLLLALGAILGCLFVAAAPASAHPLGNFTVNRYTGILVQPDGVQVDHVVDLAEIPTAQLGSAIDDLPALAADQCASTGPELDIRVGGTPVRLALDSSSASTADGEGGLPITRITCGFSGTADIGADEVTVEDNSAPGSVGWREITAVGDRDDAHELGRPGHQHERPPQLLSPGPAAVPAGRHLGHPRRVARRSGRGAARQRQRGADRDPAGLAVHPRHRPRRRQRLGGRAPRAPRGPRPGCGTCALAGARQDRDGVLPLPARRLLPALRVRRGQRGHHRAHRVGPAAGPAGLPQQCLRAGAHLSLADPGHRCPHLRPRSLPPGPAAYGRRAHPQPRRVHPQPRTRAHARARACSQPWRRAHPRARRPRPRARPRPRRTTTEHDHEHGHGHDHGHDPRARPRARARSRPPARSGARDARLGHGRRRPPPRPRRPSRSPRPPPGGGACG